MHFQSKDQPEGEDGIKVSSKVFWKRIGFCVKEGAMAGRTVEEVGLRVKEKKQDKIHEQRK